MDFIAPIGLVLAIASIAIGFTLEGGQLAVLFQPEGLLIVGGGTLAAVMVQNSLGRFLDGLRLVGWVFIGPKPIDEKSLATLIAWGRKAMLEGVVALESVDTRDIGQFAGSGLPTSAMKKAARAGSCPTPTSSRC